MWFLEELPKEEEEEKAWAMVSVCSPLRYLSQRRWESCETLEIVLPIRYRALCVGMAWCHENQGRPASSGGQVSSTECAVPSVGCGVGSKGDLLALRLAGSLGAGQDSGVP